MHSSLDVFTVVLHLWSPCLEPEDHRKNIASDFVKRLCSQTQTFFSSTFTNFQLNLTNFKKNIATVFTISSREIRLCALELRCFYKAVYYEAAQCDSVWCGSRPFGAFGGGLVGVHCIAGLLVSGVIGTVDFGAFDAFGLGAFDAVSFGAS